jgi:hypothetical protein
VGGVSEGPTLEVGLGVIRVRRSSGRSGGRHPGLRDGVDLRGSASERRSWFGPLSGKGSSPLGNAPATADVQRTLSKGTNVRMGSSKRMHRTRETRKRASRASAEDASLSWSSDPCTSIATATPSGQLAEVAHSNRYRGRENLVKARRNRHRGRYEWTVCGSPLVTASARERAWQVEKRKGIKVPVPARIVRARAECPYVVAVAEIDRRRLAPNTLDGKAT